MFMFGALISTMIYNNTYKAISGPFKASVYISQSISNSLPLLAHFYLLWHITAINRQYVEFHETSNLIPFVW